MPEDHFSSDNSMSIILKTLILKGPTQSVNKDESLSMAPGFSPGSPQGSPQVEMFSTLLACRLCILLCVHCRFMKIVRGHLNTLSAHLKSLGQYLH